MSDPRVSAQAGRHVGATKSSISTSSTLNALNEARMMLNGQNTVAQQVGAGMRGLVSLSKALGLGGKLPFSIDNLSSNTKWVLGQLGIDSQAVMRVGQKDPSLAGAGQSAAQSVFSLLINGKLTNTTAAPYIPPITQLGIKNYHIVHASSQANKTSQSDRLLEVSPYAMDLLYFAPKFKFMFVVQIQLNAAYIPPNSDFMKQFAFVVKKSSRPAVKYHTEDVNYYNFRTSVVTKADWEEMSMSFYDDGMNNAAAFYSLYTRAMSPVLNYMSASETATIEDEGLINNKPGDALAVDIPNVGGAFAIADRSSGSVGALAADAKTLISEIKIFHVYDNGKNVNIYTFINPRLTSLDLDELDMSSSELNMLDIKFKYETVFVELGRSMQEIGQTIGDLTNVGQYPLHYVGDTSSNLHLNQQNMYGTGTDLFSGHGNPKPGQEAHLEAQKFKATAQKRVRVPSGKNDSFFSKYGPELKTASNLLAGAFTVFGKLK